MPIATPSVPVQVRAMKHRILTLSLLLVSLAAPAEARCVVADDLGSGVHFRREDGRAGVAVREGNKVRINYAAVADEWSDMRLAVLGIYETQGDFHFNTQETVGGGYPRYTWTFAGRPPVPKPGKRWNTQVSQSRSEDIGTEVMPPPERSRYQATYTFLDSLEVTLSGCQYRVIPVEAATGTGTATLTQRWLYFPDLGFGLETRVAAHLPGTEDRRGLLTLTVN